MRNPREKWKSGQKQRGMEGLRRPWRTFYLCFLVKMEVSTRPLLTHLEQQRELVLSLVLTSSPSSTILKIGTLKDILQYLRGVELSLVTEAWTSLSFIPAPDLCAFLVLCFSHTFKDNHTYLQLLWHLLFLWHPDRIWHHVCASETAIILVYLFSNE